MTLKNLRGLQQYAKERQPRQSKEMCLRCGRGVPPRRRDTGYCSNKCEGAQIRDDRESSTMEDEIVAGGEE